jgi:hypothetical protein
MRQERGARQAALVVPLEQADHRDPHCFVRASMTTTVPPAAARGIRIQSISTKREGDVDPQGLLALDDTVPAG